MKRIMELNGVANIDLMLQVEADIKPDGQVVMNLETLNSIKEELVMLERYMLAYNRAVTNGTQTPFWHEVRANPKLYPRNRESKD
jgi:hypothetical protein